MFGMNVRNVNGAYSQGRKLLEQVGVPENSRAGPVLVAPGPVVTVYQRPTERVLFDEVRDANPFFHLFESIWMLAGRNDAAFLDQFVKDFGSRFAEPSSQRLHGAYGHRWRKHFGVNQLDVVVHRLRRDPADRRVVITMWTPDDDLIGPDDIDPKTGEASWDGNWPEPRDLPCNTHIYPRVRTEKSDAVLNEKVIGRSDKPVLDLTVLCRSNDIVWGAYGANAVHFSVLQEYLAAAIGVEVGSLIQFSNNWHGYIDVLAKIPTPYHFVDPYIRTGTVVPPEPTPIVTVPGEFLRDCERFCNSGAQGVYANKWFTHTAVPMLMAFTQYRDGDKLGAAYACDKIEARDWRMAAQRWIARRIKR